MEAERQAVGEWWPLKLKLLEANYEKSKLKIRESSLYCKLSIIQLQNIVGEEKLITEKYEKKAVAERLLVAKEQVIKHAKEKEAISKKAVDDLKTTEEEWQRKTTELAKKIESLQEEKQKETRSKKILVEEVSTELDILKEREKEWKTEHTRLLSKVGIMEKEHEKFSEMFGKQKVDKEVQAETFDVDGVKNGAKYRNPPKSKSTDKSQNITTPKSLRSRHFDKNNQIAEKPVPQSVPEVYSETDIGKIDKSIKDREEGSGSENDYNRDAPCSRRRSSLRVKQCVEMGIPSMKETEKGLRSCRKRSATETAGCTARRSRSVSPGNLNDTTGSKRSRKAKCDTENNRSVLCESSSVAKKKQRRVTFSGELEIREFDKCKEWEEIIQDGVQVQQSTNRYNLRKPFNKQGLRNDHSLVARDVLSVGAGSDSISRMDLLKDANDEEGYQTSGGLKKKKKPLEKVDQRKQEEEGVKIREESGVEEESKEVCDDVLTSEVIPISRESLINEHKNDCEEKRNSMGGEEKREKAEAVAQETVKKTPRRAGKENIKLGHDTKKEEHFDSEDVLDINTRRETNKSGKQNEIIGIDENKDCSINEASLHCEVEIDDQGGREDTGNKSGNSGMEGIEEETACEDMQEKEEAVVKQTRKRKVQKSATDKKQRGRNKTVSESESKDSEERLPSNGKKVSRKGKKGTTVTVKNQILKKKEASLDAATMDDWEIGVRTARSSRGKRGIAVDCDETQDKAVLKDGNTSKEALQIETDVELPVAPKSKSKGQKASSGNKTKNYDQHETEKKEIVTRQRGAKRRMAALNDEREDEDEEEEVDGTKRTAEQRKCEKTTSDESSTLNEIRESEKEKVVTYDNAINEATSLHCEVQIDDQGGREETGNRSGNSGMEGIEEETAYEDMQEKEEAVVKQTRKKKVKKSATEKKQRGRNKTVSESESKDSEEGLSSNVKKVSRKGKNGTIITIKNQIKKKEASLDAATEGEEVDDTKRTAEQGKCEKTTSDESSSLNEIRESEKEKMVTYDKSQEAAESSKGKSGEKTTRTRESRSRNKEVSMNDEKRDGDSEEGEKNENKSRQRAVKGGKVKSRRGTKVDMEEVRKVKETPKTGRDKETVNVQKSLKLRKETLSCEAGCDGIDKNEGMKAIDHESEDKEKQEVGEKKKTREDERVEKTPVVRRKSQLTNKAVSLNDETKEGGDGEKGRKKVARQKRTKRGMNGENKETEDNGEEQEMKDTINKWREEKSRSSFAVNEKNRSNEAACKGKAPSEGEKENERIVVEKTREKANVSGISNETTENKSESVAKTSSKLQLPAGSSNVTIGQQAARTAVDLQTTMDVTKPAKKKRRTLYSNKENSRMISTTTLFQGTLPLNQTKSSGSMPPSLSSFMKSFIIPKLKK